MTIILWIMKLRHSPDVAEWPQVCSEHSYTVLSVGVGQCPGQGVKLPLDWNHPEGLKKVLHVQVYDLPLPPPLAFLFT